MLKILFGDQLLEFTEDDLDYMYLDEGNESEVFKYGSSVLKIYKPYCLKDRLSEESVLKLSKLQTQRLLLPEIVIRSAADLRFVGYSMPFKYKYPKDAVLRLKMGKFLEELDLIEDDISILSDQRVEIEDLHMDNVLYDGSGFFIGDPGSYEFDLEQSRNRIYSRNIATLNRFVKLEIFSLAKISKKKKQELDGFFEDSFYIGDQLRDEAKENETIGQFVKRITR